MPALADPAPSAARSRDHAADELWTEIDRAFPRSETVGVALVPWVVELAASTPRSRRIRHVAFVAEVAFGGRRGASRISPPLAELGYRGVSAAAGRVAREATHTRIWDAWEARCLISACERIVGRLRLVCSAALREIPDAGLAARPEHELASWLLAEMSVAARATEEPRAVAPGPSSRCAQNAVPRRTAAALALASASLV